MADPPSQPHFDVFLSHNSKDKPAVIELARRLQASGVKVWLDAWELRPGHPWQEALEDIIASTRAAAVLVGKDGLGPWEEAEMSACLDEFARRRLPVIPVLLPGCPEKPKLPLLLRRFTWVDCRDGGEEEGFFRLVWGITGNKPEIKHHIESDPEFLVVLRIEMLTAKTSWELQKILFQVENYLSVYPSSVPARLLKLQIDKAINFAGRAAFAACNENISTSKPLLSYHRKFIGWRLTILSLAIIGAFIFELDTFNPNSNPTTNQETKMISLPGGEFLMGSEKNDDLLVFKDELHSHKVTVQPFSIGKYEVTVGEYRVFAEATQHQSQGCNVYSGSAWKMDANKSWRDPGFQQTGRHPVVCVSHQDAKAYAAWLKEKTGKPYRLPTEAEWEYAARAGTTTPWYWPGGEQAAGAYAWYSENSGNTTHPVGEKKPNRFGLYDMAGNAWEWVEDSWHENYQGAPTDGRAWLDEKSADRVLRGGSWFSLGRYVRSADRNGDEPDNRCNYAGFRLALGQRGQ